MENHISISSMNGGIEMLIKDKVLEILINQPKTRDNDNLLIAYVLKDMYGLQNTFDIALYTNKNLYESVRRTRAKIQETNPNLRPSDDVYQSRLAYEQIVREEMRGL